MGCPCYEVDFANYTSDIDCCTWVIKDEDGKVIYHFNLANISVTQVPTNLVQVKQMGCVSKLAEAQLLQLGLTVDDVLDAVKGCLCVDDDGTTNDILTIGLERYCRCLISTGEEHEIRECKMSDGSIVIEDITLGTTITEAQLVANYKKTKDEKEYKCEDIIYTLEEGQTVNYADLLADANATALVTAALGGNAEGINGVRLQVEDKKGVIEKATLNYNGKVEELITLEGWEFNRPEGTNIPADFAVTSDKGCVKILYSVYRCV